MVLAILPGSATALFLHRSLRDRRRCGLAAVAGNEIGIFSSALAAATGLTVMANRMRPWLSRAEIRRRTERAPGVILVALSTELAVTTR
jgi:threonine/homoserine/homoserine lactone efflux protein